MQRRSGRVVPILIVVTVLIGVPLVVVLVEARRKGLSPWEILGQMTTRAAPTTTGLEGMSRSVLPKGEPVDFLAPQPIGDKFERDRPPRIAHVCPVDLDRNGLLDILVCDCLNNRVSWIRQQPRGTFSEIPLADVRAPAHARAVDMNGDGHLDILVASMGILWTSNDKVGSVIILENDGHMKFKPHVLLDHVARVTDVSAGDLNGDGKLDLAVAQFGYDDGETRWMENLGNWQFKSHVLQSLSGPINAEIVDMNADGKLDVVTLVSQEWEEIYVFVNDGKGNFTPKMVHGSSNEDFGSSWIQVVDLDQDGKPDILYSNGDAFDYLPPRPRPWHGVQWLENQGDLEFRPHRIADFPGASSPQAVDLTGSGHLDVVVVSGYNFWDKPDAQSIVWLENDGHMQFTLHDIATSPTHLVTLGVGDFDGSGKPDLVTGGLHVYPPYDRLGRVTLWKNRSQRKK
jgi:hypothetical protein